MPRKPSNSIKKGGHITCSYGEDKVCAYCGKAFYMPITMSTQNYVYKRCKGMHSKVRLYCGYKCYRASFEKQTKGDVGNGKSK